MDIIGEGAGWGALGPSTAVFVYGLGVMRFHLIDNDQLLTLTV